MTTSIHVFTAHCLRLHDNPALVSALTTEYMVPIFCFDPALYSDLSANRVSFLLQSLADIDSSLRARGSRLFVLRGDTTKVVPALAANLRASLVTLAAANEPRTKAIEAKLTAALEIQGARVVSCTSHVLREPSEVVAAGQGSVPNQFRGLSH